MADKWSKWDYILDLKPKPVVTHLLDEVAKLLAKDLAQFPPPIEGFESATAEARFRPLFADASHLPPHAPCQKSVRALTLRRGVKVGSGCSDQFR